MAISLNQVRKSEPKKAGGKKSRQGQRPWKTSPASDANTPQDLPPLAQDALLDFELKTGAAKILPEDLDFNSSSSLLKDLGLHVLQSGWDECRRHSYLLSRATQKNSWFSRMTIHPLRIPLPRFATRRG